MIETEATVASSAPTFEVDLYSPEMLDDPWETLTQIREAGPVVWNPLGFWMTAHDRVCRRILQKPEAIGQEGMVESFFGAEAFISIDDKKVHNALRGVWLDAFGKEAVEALAAFVRRTTNDLLDAVEPELRAGGKVDLMHALCRPLPTYVIAHMMGVTGEMIQAVIAWSDAMGDATTNGFPIDYANDPYWLASERAKADLSAFLRDQIRARRGSSAEDLISAIANAEMADLSEERMVVNTRQLLFAGNETTAKWLGNIFLTLGRRPDIRRRVAQDRSLLAAACEEIMRWQGVTQVLPRGVKQHDIGVGGMAVPKDAQILMLLGGANRDPERYENPDDLDIDRRPQPHLGFGFGLHHCLGAGLARVEVLNVLSVFLDRFADYQVVEPVAYGMFSLRGPAELSITLD